VSLHLDTFTNGCCWEGGMSDCVPGSEGLRTTVAWEWALEHLITVSYRYIDWRYFVDAGCDTGNVRAGGVACVFGCSG